MTGTATPATIDPWALVYYGEDGEDLAIEGHVDLDAFTAAADARLRLDLDWPGSENVPARRLSDDELPSAVSEARHVWLRPLTREWFDKHYRGYARGTSEADATAYFERLIASDEAPMEPCGPDDDGAQPWTFIGTGA